MGYIKFKALSDHANQYLEIIRANKRLIYKITRIYCPDPEDRKDLEQEILIQIWKSLKTYQPTYKLSTWLYRIALNVAISHYRKSSKRKDTIAISDNILEIADDGSESEVMNENITRLYNFIALLDNLSKAIIILHLEGSSYKEIAEILGLSETNVGTRINRIKKSLKNKFNEHVER
jgi:RNA polymerase sigma-70 factor (ECF subfamily)